MTRPAMTGTPRDHPRVGGEKELDDRFKTAELGSPPRRRGKVHSQLLVVGIVRITPAWAGKSLFCFAAAVPIQDHPRMGGEKSLGFRFVLAGPGSPPRGRGKALPGRQLAEPRGITPAQAGKICSDCRCSNRRWDHPRMGGEKASSSPIRDFLMGSPPRGRGKAIQTRPEYSDHGITPAWAGKSLASQPWSPPLWMMVIRPRP